MSIRDNMLNEYATQFAGRINKGYDVKEALEPLLGQKTLDQFVTGQGIIVGLLFDNLVDEFVLAIATDYDEDGNEKWVLRAKTGYLDKAYAIYLMMKKAATGGAEEAEKYLSEVLSQDSDVALL